VLRRFRATVVILAAAATFCSREARADVSSWFYTGVGVLATHHDQSPTDRPFTMQIEMGVGTPPHGSVIIGGVLKSVTFFGDGTDLALVMRGASGAFVRGGFGFALDAGVFQRWWGPTDSTGFMGSVVLGAPLGLQLAATIERGLNDVQTYGATLGIDFLRLTVYRTALRSFWPNPFPPANADGTR
jgi:hypothetical protein